MKVFEYFDAQVDLFFSEAANGISDVQDELRYGSWYMEDGDKKKSLTIRLKDIVTNFFSKIRNSWNNLFEKKVVKDAMEASSNNGGEETKINLEKQKVAEEICNEGEKTIQNLDKCKTEEEVDKEMARYRKKIKGLKIAAVATTVTVGGGVAYVFHKRKEMLNTWKQQETARLKEIDKLNEQLTEEKTTRAKEVALARAEKEAAAAEKLQMQNKIKHLESQNKIAQKQGAAEGRTAVLKAKLEVTADQSRITTEAIGEISQKLSSASSIGEKLEIIKGGVTNTVKTNENTARNGIGNTKSRAKDVHSQGKHLREQIDEAIRVLEGNVSIERKRNALNWLTRAEPTFHRLGGKYATMVHDIKKWENQLNMQSVRRTRSVPK